MNRKMVVIVVTLVITACLVPAAWAGEESADSGPGDSHLEKAEVNPDFTTFLEEKKAGKWISETAEGRKLGFIPPTVNLDHLEGETLPKEAFLRGKHVTETELVTEYPADFDLRDEGKVTPVRDQGQCGSCWAFATYGSLESSLTFLAPPEIWDFSENNLKNTHGFDAGHCDGGNQYMSTAYLARWSGPVLESADPYDFSSGSSPSGLPAQKHVQDVTFIPKRSGSLDNTNIKNAIYSTGAVYSTFYLTSDSYNPVTYSYYYSGKPTTSNHAIALVGWDDTFSRHNFNRVPKTDGAFIAKNSWGTGWGEDGYFYISYYDRNIGKDNAVFTGESLNNYDNLYEYDPLGWITSYGCRKSDTAWFANVFTSGPSENLEAVSFYTPAVNSRYEITIYTGLTNGPIGSVNALTQSETITTPGYHTVELAPPVELESEQFSVVVKLTTPGYRYPIPVEQAISGYSTASSAGSGESYVSCDGNSWTDLTSRNPSANVCLKAFTDD